MRDFIPNKKEHRSDYFKVIDSEVKAYILGYLVADGSIEESVRKDRPSKLVRLRFGCASEDDEIIRLIQKENRKLTPYWSLHFSYSMKVRKPIFNYLYKDATVFLKRKRDKALNTVLNAVDKRTAQCNA